MIAILYGVGHIRYERAGKRKKKQEQARSKISHIQIAILRMTPVGNPGRSATRQVRGKLR